MSASRKHKDPRKVVRSLRLGEDTYTGRDLCIDFTSVSRVGYVSETSSHQRLVPGMISQIVGSDESVRVVHVAVDSPPCFDGAAGYEFFGLRDEDRAWECGEWFSELILQRSAAESSGDFSACPETYIFVEDLCDIVDEFPQLYNVLASCADDAAEFGLNMVFSRGGAHWYQKAFLPAVFDWELRSASFEDGTHRLWLSTTQSVRLAFEAG